MTAEESDGVRSGALVALAAGVGSVALAYGAAFFRTPPPAWATWLMAGGTVGSIVAAMVLGAVKKGALGRLWIAFAAVVVLVGGGFFALLLLPATGSADPDLVLGLPPRAAVLLYGIGLLPTLVVPVAYALTFDRLTLTEEDLESVRRARRAREAAVSDGPVGGVGLAGLDRAAGGDGGKWGDGPERGEPGAGEPER